MTLEWTPTERQNEYLAAPDDEVLYGGAAGGGKTDALVVDATGCQYDTPSIAYPRYRGVIFRRTFPELEEFVDRSHMYYPQIDRGAKFRGDDYQWTFSSGAKISFSYLELDKHKLRHQGKEYQFIGWEELTQWATPAPYEYLSSRLRTSDPRIPLNLRANCNPGGAGDWWVRDRWRIPDDGSATRFPLHIKDPDTGKITTRWRRFIPARLGDNPHLGADYKARLLGLSDQEQKALLYGRWDLFDVEGAIYAAQLKKVSEEGRICELPIVPGIPVNTFWDLGRNNETVILFHQRVGAWNHFIDYFEMRLGDLATFAKVLKDKGYLFGDHYLPHDVENTDISVTKSRKELLEEAGVKPIIVVPRVRHVIEGIELTRQAFASCKFDAERCAGLIRALRAYRYVHDDRLNTFKPEPLHDWASNAADAFRQFGQGYTPSVSWNGLTRGDLVSGRRADRISANRNRGDWTT